MTYVTNMFPKEIPDFTFDEYSANIMVNKECIQMSKVFFIIYFYKKTRCLLSNLYFFRFMGYTWEKR